MFNVYNTKFEINNSQFINNLNPSIFAIQSVFIINDLKLIENRCSNDFHG